MTALGPRRQPADTREGPPSAMGRDIAILSCATLLGAGLGVAQVFLIPRLVSVEEYGYWRLFVLYASYAGVLHMGLADGALLRWAGRPLEEFRGEVSSCLRFLLWQHAILAAPAALALLWLLQRAPQARAVALAVLGYAVVWNAAVLLQFALQASRRFLPAALASTAPAALFLALAGLCAARWALGARALIACYIAAWGAVLLLLGWQVRPVGGSAAWPAGRRYIGLGWPMMLANTGYGIMLCADRLVLSSVASIGDFAQYSLAASTLFVPITVIQAVARAVFPHLAAQPRQDQATSHRQGSRLIALSWMALLPYGVAVDWFVRHALPAYVSSLAVMKVLLLSVPFLAVIQILQMSAFNLHGRQKEFLGYAAGAVAAGLALGLAASRLLYSLVAVAAAEVLTVAAWWAWNEWRLRHQTGARAGDWSGQVGILAAGALTHAATARYLEGRPGLQVCAYLVALAVTVRMVAGAHPALLLRSACLGSPARRCDPEPFRAGD